jgi:hypothetical protein
MSLLERGRLSWDPRPREWRTRTRVQVEQVKQAMLWRSAERMLEGNWETG